MNLTTVFLLMAICVLTALSADDAVAQTGSGFTVTQFAIDGGGGLNSSGEAFQVSGTIGQKAPGQAFDGGLFDLRGGFWNPQFVPTAAAVSVSGRVVSADGRGIVNAVVTITSLAGNETLSMRTGSFGHYRIGNLRAGETYLLSVRFERFAFAADSRLITPSEDLSGEDFVALPE